MRDIKFRAYDKSRGDMFTGDFFVNNSGMAYQIIDSSYCGNDVVKFNDNLIIMQFTGLQDKNGVDIYESDLIINESGRVSEVVFNEYCATFDSEVRYTSGKDSDYGFKNSMWKNYVLVIGNIHSNPELLEK